MYVLHNLCKYLVASYISRYLIKYMSHLGHYAYMYVEDRYIYHLVLTQFKRNHTYFPNTFQFTNATVLQNLLLIN